MDDKRDEEIAVYLILEEMHLEVQFMFTMFHDLLSVIDQSTIAKPAKRKRTRGSMTDGFASALQEFTAMLGTYMESSEKRMQMLTERIGYAKDASNDRKNVYGELTKVEFASDVDRIRAAHKIVAKQVNVDVFFSLPNDSKALYANMLLNSQV